MKDEKNYERYYCLDFSYHWGVNWIAINIKYL
ncbi:MAG: hypothetical protein QT02_C0010G0008 [archaeon GW2011_AR9]|nr:MAG: hypothetical protein QT02_C0010G0008 [archaeon GW2011_AR9]